MESVSCNGKDDKISAALLLGSLLLITAVATIAWYYTTPLGFVIVTILLIYTLKLVNKLTRCDVTEVITLVIFIFPTAFLVLTLFFEVIDYNYLHHLSNKVGIFIFK